MNASDIDDVVRIHEKVLPTTTARIGLLPFFYRCMINHPDEHIALVATEKTRIIGAITVTRDAHKTQAYLAKLSTLLPLLSAIMRRRVTVSELLDRMFTEHATIAVARPYQTMLTLVVDSHWQRKGIGARLVSSLNVNGKLYVDTETTNIKAQQFYKRIGFRFIKTIRNSMIAVKMLTQTPYTNILG